MKHILLLLSSFCIYAPSLLGQSVPDCATDWWIMHDLQFSEFQERHQPYEQGILQIFEQKKQVFVLPENPKTIPVVIHLVHQNGPENLSNTQVEQAITWLNQAMANQGNFNQGSGTDCGIQFCLAKRTPTNTATNGITRTVNALTEMEMEFDNLALKNLIRWEPKQYLNIWVVKKICSATYGCGVYGYTHLPYAHGSNIDGIVMEASYLENLSKIAGLAHEIGHYLGLYHTFEGSCSNNNCQTDGDRICDTPPDESTAGVPCGDQVNTCNTDTNSGPFSSDQPDMSWNFLDYGILSCFHDFTPDQATRMNATLEGVRKSLLESKGCQPPCTTQANANFLGPNTANAGDIVTYTSNSTNAGSFSWTVNGQPAGNQSTLNYQFLTPGEYIIKLLVQATNTALCDPDEMTKTVVVGCQVVSAFTASNLAPEADQQVYFTNNSQNASQTEWYINGALQTQPLDSIMFGSPGEYSIELVSGNSFCADTQELVILVQGVCVQKTFAYDFNTSNANADDFAVCQLIDGQIIFGFNAYWFEQPHVVKMKPNGQFIWSKGLGDTLTLPQYSELKATSDGGFLAAWDYFMANQMGEYDTSFYALGKYTSDGDPVWQKKLIWQSQLGQLNRLKLVTTINDEIYLTEGKMLSKFTQNGNLIWAKQREFQYIDAYIDGGIIGVTVVDHSLMVTRLDPDGTTVWSRIFQGTPGQIVNGLKVDSHGDIYVTGQRLNTVTYHGSLLKITANGELVWSKSFRQIPSSTYTVNLITIGANGNIVLVGNATLKDPVPGPLKFYKFVISFDTSGVLAWSRHTLGNWTPEDISPLVNGGFVIAGYSPKLTKLDALGQLSHCDESPHEVNVEPTFYQTRDTLLTGLDLALSFEPAFFAPRTLPIHFDTICVPACEIAVEICNNNLDDDGDGLFDCLDPQCNCEEERCDSQTGNLWYFGNKGGLDFSTSPPTVQGNGQSTSDANSATLCDAKGNLLLYTDGKQIFNRFHEPMPNGNFLNFGQVKDALIIPHTGQPGQFYVIIIDGASNVYYSLVDITLEDGKGDVVTGQNNFLLASDVQGLAAIKSCAFNGYWFVTRKFDQQGNFLAYRIDQNGINLTPVVSPTNQPVGMVSQIKISPDGQRIACTYYSNSIFDSSAVSIYRFDPASGGTVTNPQLLVKLKDPFKTFGVEFSPNVGYLYVTGLFPGNFQLVQYNLNAGNIQAIINSRIGISKLPGQAIAFLQLAPDGKIYAPTYTVLQQTAYYLDVINKPNNPGLTCQFEHNAIDLSVFFPNGTAKDGTCNVIASILGQPSISLTPESPDTVCAIGISNIYELEPLGCGLDSITWQVAGLGAQIQSNFQSAIITYLNYGNAKVIVKAFSPCGNVSDTLDVFVVAPSNDILNLGPDLEVCDNGVFTFHAGSGFVRYLWSDGSTDSTTTTLFPGVYWVNVWDACNNMQTDTIVVSIKPGSILNVGPDIPQTCSGFTQTYALPSAFSSWNWSPGTFLNCTNCQQVSVSPEVSTAWVIVGITPEGCISVDTLWAEIRDTLLFTLDTFVCTGQTLALFGSQLPADTTAQFLLPASGLGCDTLWTVQVMGVEAASTNINVTICANATYPYNGQNLLPGTTTSFPYSTLHQCDSTVLVTVNSYPPLVVALPMDTTVRIGGSVLLESKVNGSAPYTYSWTPPDFLSCQNCPSPLANPLDSTAYMVVVTDANGCSAEESILILINQECRIRIPNAFTPNGDGANDVFQPLMDPCIRKVLGWKLVNRWGETVFEQYNLLRTDQQLGWDGNWKGAAHPSDVLIWYGTFEKFTGERVSESGQVTLIR